MADRCPINGRSLVHGVNIVRIKSSEARLVLFIIQIHIQPRVNDLQTRNGRESTGEFSDNYITLLFDFSRHFRVLEPPS